VRRRVLATSLALVAALAGGAASAAERDDVAAAPPGPLAGPTTPVLSPRRVPGLLVAPVADRRLAAALDALLAGQPGVTCLTVASAGRELYDRDGGRPLVPASLHKLRTAVAALEVLGPEHRFRTRVVAAAAPVDGAVAGDAWLVGSGDPLLATAPYAARFRNQPQVRTPLEALADAAVDAGIRRIDGRLVGDESRYDADRYPDAWPARFADQDQSGPLSALTVDDGWAAYPPNPDTRVPDEAPAPDPAAHAAGTLAVLLGQRGVATAAGAASGVAPPGAVELLAVESPPLRDVVGQMLRESDNQTAELLVKELAVARGRPGTTAEGIAVMEEVLTGLGHAAPGSVVVDGSGLGGGNLLTCDVARALLDAEPAVEAGLAVAGETGTLAERFVGSAVTGRLRAKTGTLNQVTALAGVLDTAGGADLTFSFIVNLPAGQFVGPADLARQDELAAILDRYPEGPSLDELGPQPVAVPAEAGAP